MQLFDPHQNNVHTFGLMTSSNITFASVQNAMKAWSNSGYLTFDDTKSITGPVVLTIALKPSVNDIQSKTVIPSSTPAVCPTSPSRLVARAEYSTDQVQGGDSCAALTERCRISGDGFIKYNHDNNFYSNFTPGQHVYYSAVMLPDFALKPNEDGSCHTYEIIQDNNCANITAERPLDKEDLEEFNKNTWGWNDCKNIWPGTIICLSEGSPPMLASLANAVCSPQDYNLDGVNLDSEYPGGASDIPGIPLTDKDNGDIHLLPGKSVSIMADSSYFYLEDFPIEKISKAVD
ncbi:hypothetical protein BDW59DRAFT_164739 [Aspergillus cavernicola]|uniref:LysM domain-containing protein n=1 Tax=Aspergillus cavernicola TaxID=176166 RepID=A0ABR4HXN6_9EURO